MKIALYCILLLLCSSYISPSKNSATGKAPDFDTTVYNATGTLAQVLQLVKQKHYRPTKDLENCMYDAIDTFLSHLDPHSGFLPPKSYSNILTMMSGEFCGIGVVIDVTRQTKDRFLTVVDTIAEGPAEKAGVKPFDKIVEIDGQILKACQPKRLRPNSRANKEPLSP